MTKDFFSNLPKNCSLKQHHLCKYYSITITFTHSMEVPSLIISSQLKLFCKSQGVKTAEKWPKLAKNSHFWHTHFVLLASLNVDIWKALKLFMDGHSICLQVQWTWSLFSQNGLHENGKPYKIKQTKKFCLLLPTKFRCCFDFFSKSQSKTNSIFQIYQKIDTQNTCIRCLL